MMTQEISSKMASKTTGSMNKNASNVLDHGGSKVHKNDDATSKF